MIIRSIAVNDFMKFDHPVEIAALDEKLNIIAGPNEMGKSTILSAMRAAFFGKHRSKHKEIRDLQHSHNKGAPCVRVDFEIGGEQYQIRKRFLKHQIAELRLPNGRLIKGDEAEEVLSELLSFDNSGSLDGQPKEMWNLFWVEQGKSFTPVDVSEGARSGLQSVLESQVNTVLGGRRGRELLQQFTKEKRVFLTPTGKPTGKFKQVSAHIDAVQDEIVELETKRTSLLRDLERLETCQQNLKRLEDDESRNLEKQELEQFNARYEELRQIELKIEAARGELGQTNEQHSSMQNELQVLCDFIKELNKVRMHFGALEAELKDSSSQEQELNAKKTSIQSTVGGLNNQIAEAERNSGIKKEILSLAQLWSKNANLEQRLELAASAQSRKEECLKAANQILVSDQILRQIEQLNSKLESAQATITANATEILFQLKTEGAEGISINGEPLKNEKQRLEAVSEVTIDFPDRGTIRVKPAVQNADQLLEARQVAQKNLDSMLAQANADSVEDARQLNQVRKVSLQEAESANREIQAHLSEFDQAEGGIEAIKINFSQQKSLLTTSASNLGLAELPTVSVAEELLAQSEGALAQLRSSLETPAKELRQAEDRLAAAKLEIANMQGQIEIQTQQIKSLETKIELRGGERKVSELNEKIDQLKERAEQQAVDLQKLEDQLDKTEVQLVLARIGRLEDQMRNRQAQIQELRDEVNQLIGRIESQEGAGIDEQIAQKQRELERERNEYDKIEKEVEVLKLLLDTLSNAQQEATERYLSPVKSKIRPYLNVLFPNANIEFDEELNILSVNRNFNESFQNLSMGTQEQIAVLVRLTFAELLAQKGRPATVILDDALVFSDEERLKTMFDILYTSSRNIQIIILTCRGSLFEGLGGRVLNLNQIDVGEFQSG